MPASTPRPSPSQHAKAGAKKSAASTKRKRVDPTTCERDYHADELEFMNAVHSYKHKHGRPFPTFSELLEVLKGLGYQKVRKAT